MSCSETFKKFGRALLISMTAITTNSVAGTAADSSPNSDGGTVSITQSVGDCQPKAHGHIPGYANRCTRSTLSSDAGDKTRELTATRLPIPQGHVQEVLIDNFNAAIKALATPTHGTALTVCRGTTLQPTGLGKQHNLGIAALAEGIPDTAQYNAFTTLQKLAKGRSINNFSCYSVH